MSLRFKVCLLAWATVVAVTAMNQNASGQDLTPIPQSESPVIGRPDVAPDTLAAVADEDWQIQILPAVKVKSVTQAEILAEPAPAADTVDSNDPDVADCEGCGRLHADYAQVYASIPFNRAEYNVNPSYRHDSTMEILTGNARHQTIVRHNTTRTLTSVPRAPATIGPTYGYPGNPYNYGYLRPALRLQYYRHFPSLNPYLNIWNFSGAY